jgi:NarL family two-component system response regulator LiaR
VILLEVARARRISSQTPISIPASRRRRNTSAQLNAIPPHKGWCPHLAVDSKSGHYPDIFMRAESRAGGDILLHNPFMKRHVLIFGLVGGLLIATLHYTEYRFVVMEHSVELYSALVAILFATFGIWLGLRITRNRETIRETVVVREVLVPALAPAPVPTAVQPFAPNAARQRTLGITARELEILTLVARGHSNREIATQLFVSENTVKTHCARAFDKLGAARRTQAVQRGKELGLLP